MLCSLQERSNGETVLAYFHTKHVNGQQVVEDCCTEDYQNFWKSQVRESTERC